MTTQKNTKTQKNTTDKKATAKNVVPKNTRKGKPYSVKVDDKTLNCTTTCKTIGEAGYPLVDENNIFIKKCKKCKIECQEVCFGLNKLNHPVVAEKKKIGGKRGPSEEFKTLQVTGPKTKEWNGILRTSSMFEFVTFLNENGPSTMGEIKKAIRRTHYATVKKYPELFVKTGSKFSLVKTEGV